MKDLVVLHVSDLHFGIEHDIREKTKYIGPRQGEMLKSLIDTIVDFSGNCPDWKPDVIAISGDIAWSGQKEEYELYKDDFVRPISEALGIQEDHFITCPGNHDIIRAKVRRISRHNKKEKDPDVPELTMEEMVEQAEDFKNYVDELCNGNPEEICKAITFEEWPWATFLTLNSAWDCRDDYDEERLRVGLPILENLIYKIPETNCVITLFHHPHTTIYDSEEKQEGASKQITKVRRQWLHISELISDTDGGRTFASYVENKSTYILNGHIHCETTPKKAGRATQIISGTMYSNDTPQYHCRL